MDQQQPQDPVVAMNARIQQLEQQVALRRAGNHRIERFGAESHENWTLWREHFISTATLNGFDDRQSRLALRGAMVGKAAWATLDIDVLNADYPTIAHVMQLFQARFRPAAASQLERVKFDGARQYNSETTLNYHSRLRAIYNDAYPNANDETPLIRKFIQGLKSKDLKLQVLRTNPDTYQEALEAAQNEASVLQLGKLFDLGASQSHAAEPMEIGAMQPNGNRATNQQTANRPSYNGSNKKKGNCHHCGKAGHWKRECYSAQNAAKKKFAPGRAGRVGQALVAAMEAVVHGLKEDDLSEDEDHQGSKHEDEQYF